MTSSTRLYVNPALRRRRRAPAIEDLVLLLRSVLESRLRVMVEVNVPASGLDALVAILPCMREPTVSTPERRRRLRGEGRRAARRTGLR